MRYVYILTILSALLSTTLAWAQKSTANQAHACVVVPVFHCVQRLEEGSAIAHFGYDLQCPEDAGIEAEVYIDIGDDNLFSLYPVDRGQPKVFLPGLHIDEFEVEFSIAEVKGGDVIHWSVLGQTAVVDFSKIKDESLDCSIQPQ
ncbi:MAG: hypothetical protein IMF15_07485 [Proteobacteria bacterium]|nr:hypothetical protein [Pseudomonadota bacterium]